MAFAYEARATNIADIDNATRFTAARSVMGKLIGRVLGSTAKLGLRRGTSETTSISPTASTIPESAARREATASTAKATAESATATKSSARGKPTSSGEAILTDLERASLPIVAVELGDGVACVFRSLEGNDTAALGTTVRTDVDVGTNHGPCGNYQYCVANDK